jgi:hypothetical protein
MGLGEYTPHPPSGDWKTGWKRGEEIERIICTQQNRGRIRLMIKSQKMKRRKIRKSCRNSCIVMCLIILNAGIDLDRRKKCFTGTKLLEISTFFLLHYIDCECKKTSPVN